MFDVSGAHAGSDGPARSFVDEKGLAMRCAFCGDTVDLKDPEVFSLVARWDDNSPPRREDAIHRACLARGRAAIHQAPARAISLIQQ